MLKDANGSNRLKYFNEQFVSPDAWRKVLDQAVNGVPLNTLHLCLAHLGGDTNLGLEWGKQIVKMIKGQKYPNLYADISSSFDSEKFRDYFKEIMQGPDGKLIEDRILFGTDWYLTLLDGVDYTEFCLTAKNALDEYNTSLWPKFTQYNPYKFYRLEEQIKRIADNIVKRRQIMDINDSIKPLKDETIAEIDKEVAYIKLANKSYQIYEEWQCKA